MSTGKYNPTTTMNEEKYLDLLKEVYQEGEWRSDRTGTGVSSLFGKQVVYDLKDGFPLLTTKKIHWKSVVHELLWFLKGDTNVRYLQENGVHIWDSWASDNGDLGPVYGNLWRNFSGFGSRPNVDQIQTLIDGIKKDPFSRRHIVTAWDPSRIPDMALPPCHVLWQIYVHQNGEMDLQLTQRSADIFLGIPFNIASYTLLLMMIAHVTGYKAGRFIHTMGDVHLYRNHVDAYLIQKDRTILPPPLVGLSPGIKSIFDFKYEDIILENYNSHPAIKAPVAV
jgi:thymidylate synthase